MPSFDGRIRADARHLPIASESVQCVVTSPPYWGLRRYDVDGPQIGSEASPGEWVSVMVEVFREIRRVLRPDGTVWLNVGDSYCHGTGADRGPTTLQGSGVPASWSNRSQPQRIRPTGNIKTKDLCLMPHRLAIGLQDDGWWIRSEIVWEKPTCMPESVKDRPTRSHEMIFLLTRSQRYYYDFEAIQEPASPDTHARYGRGRSGKSQYPGNQTIAKTFDHMKSRAAGVNPKAAPAGSGIRNNESFSAAVKDIMEVRNKRTVWRVNAQGYPEAHYATFPEEIPEICIKAGSKPGDFVLDPFFGSGTVGRVAERLSRRWIGCDLGYQELQHKRLNNIQRELCI